MALKSAIGTAHKVRLKRRWQHVYEALIERLLFVSAVSCVAAVFMIALFVMSNGLPLILRTGLLEFVGGTTWRPLSGSFGVFPMIYGTLLVTFGALMLAVPVGLGAAAFLAELSPPALERAIRPAIQLLAGIPSVVYGFWGIVVLVPALRNLFGGSGFSALAGSIILAIMILPTIINISVDAIKSVPQDAREASWALGATLWQTTKSVVIPAAGQGIATSVVLGMGRAIGETMAVIMVTGNVTSIPSSILDPVRTLTGNIAIEIGYAHGEHQQALYATGVVLFVFIMALNLLVSASTRKRATRR
jgi:phosphate transport system permease protein